MLLITYLHSTMLLLYPGRARGMAHPERYLHSTMLLLYLTHPAGLFLPVIPFTFHYASTLSDCARHCVMEFFIYIPLCFYFILKIIVKSARLSRNLHSTMLLLYPSPPHWGAGTPRKFTFHYASTLSICRTLRSLLAFIIYIPLCFYFIRPTAGHGNGKEAHLHSTMLLLYRLKEQGCNGPVTEFTFHYASTLSTDGLIKAGSQIHLHSTMLLLYRASLRDQEFQHFHLHSTMLLLYRGKGWNTKAAEPIYIPLCFYFIGSDLGIRG